jgi:hypothetical protein
MKLIAPALAKTLALAPFKAVVAAAPLAGPAAIALGMGGIIRGSVHEAGYDDKTIAERLAMHGGGTSYQAQLRRNFDEEAGYNPAVQAGRWQPGGGQFSLGDVHSALGDRLVTAEVKGSADLGISINIGPPDFFARIETTVFNAINAFRNVNVGTSGPTGLSMPEAGSAPQ